MLEQLQVNLQSDPYTNILISKESVVAVHLRKFLKQEEDFYRKKSWVN